MTALLSELAEHRRSGQAVGAHFRTEVAGSDRAGPLPKWGRASVAVASLVATVLTWRTAPWRGVSAGLNSWQAGLALSFDHHLQWGPQMVFTFGPYGFVEDILPFSHLEAAIAFVYALAITWGLVALVVSALHPSWGLLAATAVAWLAVVTAANLLEAPELASATALALGLAVLWEPVGRARGRLLVVLAVLAAFQLLVELNVGLVATGLLALAVIGGRCTPKQIGAAVATYMGVVVVAWLAAGQSLANFWSYLRGSSQVTLGYPSAMSVSVGRTAEDVFAGVLVVLGAATFALSLRDRPRRQWAVAALMLAGWAWEAAKEGFVRHDLHDLTFFGLAFAGLCLARLPRRLVPVQATALATAAIFTMVANGGIVASERSPLEDARSLGQDIADLVVPSKFGPVAANARRQLLASGDELPKGLLGQLEGKTMAAEPWEDGLAYAYPQLRWRPEPVLQSYSAYTSYLDDEDAHFLASPTAPQRLLYQPATIDGRDPYWDPPTALVVMYCHYTQLAAVDGWQVLAHSGNRCATPKLVGSVTGHFGERFKVPKVNGALVVGEFSTPGTLVGRLEGVLLKPPSTEVTIWAGSTPSTYRFLPGTALDQHVLAAPASLGYSAAFTPPVLTSLSFSGGGWATGQGSVTAKFYAIAMR